jgi:archaellum component FlaC
MADGLPDLNFVLRRLDMIQKELREGLALMELRDQVREANYQAPQVLTRQMVSVATAIEERLNAFETRLAGTDGRLTGMEERLAGMEERLVRIETTLADIARKLDA